jgi:hypothetical protein
MQDPRLRLLSTLALSIAAYMSLAAAIAAAVWWVAFTSRTRSLSHARAVAAFMGVLAVVALATELTAGGGISYLIRMGVIVLIAAWSYSEWRSGDFLDVATWSFGKKAGFELGLVAEMGMQSLQVISEDYSRIRTSFRLKGARWGIKTLIPAVSLLIHVVLLRAEDQSHLLSIRGYRRGGTLCPSFQSAALEKIAAGVAILIVFASFVPAGHIFILLH